MVHGSIHCVVLILLCSQGDLHQDIPASKKVVAGEIGRSLQNQIESKDSARMVKFADQSPDFDVVCENLESERRLRKVTPLYQRVLSALIVDDEIEELEENDMARNESLQRCTNVAQYNAEPTERDAVQFEHESPVGNQTWKQCAGNRFFSCNGSTTSGRSPVIQNPPEHNNGLLEGKNGYLYSNFGVFDGLSGNDLDGSQIVRTNSFNIPSLDSQYEKMCMEDKLMLELQSVGIYVDTVVGFTNTVHDAYVNGYLSSFYIIVPANWLSGIYTTLCRYASVNQ